MDQSSESKIQLNTTNSEYLSELNHLRRKIDELDRQLLNTLSERMLISVKVGELKRKFNEPVLQPDRMEIILQQFKAKGSALGLNERFAAQIFASIHDESVNIQNQIHSSG